MVLETDHTESSTSPPLLFNMYNSLYYYLKRPKLVSPGVIVNINTKLFIFTSFMFFDFPKMPKLPIL